MTWREHLGSRRVRRPALRDVSGVLRWLILHDLPLKLLSILTAFGIWLFVNAGERATEVAFQVPLELQNRPADLLLVSPRVDVVDLRVSGPRTLLSRIDRDRLSIALDLSGVRPGPAIFRLQTEPLNLPRGVKVVRLTPSEVTLEFARIVRRVLPVHVTLAGKPPGGLRVANVKVTPESVRVSGPADEVERLKVVETAPFDLSEAAVGVIERDVALEAGRAYLSFTSSLVHVRVELEEPEATRVLRKVPVVVRNSEQRTTVTPTTVQISVRGPQSAVESLELASGAVYIDAAGWEAGEYRVAPVVDLPPAVALRDLEPETVRLRVLREKRKP